MWLLSIGDLSFEFASVESLYEDRTIMQIFLPNPSIGRAALKGIAQGNA